jgi:hypothetical protein
MSAEPQPEKREAKTLGRNPAQDGEEETQPIDVQGQTLREQIKGVTTQHANPPRLEDEGQSGG